MGLIDKDDIGNIMNGAIKGIKKLYSCIDTITIFEIYILIVFIAQYLYAKFAKFGDLSGSRYKVVPSTIRKSVEDDLWAEYAYNIILARNSICHYYGCDGGMDNIEVISKDRKKLKEFIEYLGICSREDSDSYPIADLVKAALIRYE